MLDEAITAGFYTSEHFPERLVPRVQILTIADLLEGRARVQYAALSPAVAYPRARRQRKDRTAQPLLL
jgi:hypothetical protein